jgi:hypothetical protein
MRPSGQTQIFDPMARALIQNSQTQAPMSNWLQPLGRLAQFGVGHYREQKGKTEANELLKKAFADPKADPQKVAAMLAGNPRTAGMANQIYATGLAARMKAKAEEGNMAAKIRYKVAEMKALMPYKMMLKRAGATRNVITIMNKRESKMAEEMGKADAKTYVDAQRAAIQGADVSAKLQMLAKLQSNVKTGPGAETQLTVAQVAQRLGMDPKALGMSGDQIADAQTYKAISMQLVMNRMSALKGAVSDREWVLLQQQVPNMSNSPEGNKRLIQVMTQLSGRMALKAKMMRKHIADKKSLDGFAEKWNEYTANNPLVSGGTAKTAPKSGTPAPPKGFKVQ